MNYKDQKTERRKRRVRLKLKGLTGLPRLSVFCSSRYIYAQIIDGEGKVFAAASDLKLITKNLESKKTERAKRVGEKIGKQALAAKIKQVAFDRGAYKYHGRVKALAEGAREAGLEF